MSNGYTVHCITLNFSFSNVLYLKKKVNQQCGLSEAGIWSTERMVQTTSLSTPLTKYYTSLPFPVDISFHSLPRQNILFATSPSIPFKKISQNEENLFLALLHYDRFWNWSLKKNILPLLCLQQSLMLLKKLQVVLFTSHWFQIIGSYLNKINFTPTRPSVWLTLNCRYKAERVDSSLFLSAC